MNYYESRLVFLTILATGLIACNRGPRVISTEAIEASTGIFDEAPANPLPGDINDDVHLVMVNEIMNDDAYSFLNVTEGDQTYWIGTKETNIKAGEMYFYSGGEWKSGMQSAENKRTFDRILLVASFVRADHGQAGVHGQSSPPTTNEIEKLNKNVSGQKGEMVAIADLVDQPEKYAGKKIIISGKCTKVNYEIMNRNWVHIKDGTRDDFDLVVTTTDTVREGDEVTLEGVVSINKDFGAGYSYELIIEEARVVK